MTQAQKLEEAKKITLTRLQDALKDFVQCGDYSWGSLEEVKGEEVWTVVNIVAKKNFDIDEAIDEWEFKKEKREKKARK